MTKMFGNLSDAGLEKEGDRLGGSFLFDTGVYLAEVKLAYAGSSNAGDSKAQSITVHLDIDGKEYRETFWITNRDGNNFYADKQDSSKKRPLPGYTMMDDLALLTTGEALTECEAEEKVHRLYDFEKRAEVPQNVPTLTPMIGQAVRVAIVRQIVNKRAKVGDEYKPTAETREENVVEKFFFADDKRTVTEIREEIDTAVFHDKWLERNAGKVRDKTVEAEGVPGVPGKPAPGKAPAPKTSLFAKK